LERRRRLGRQRKARFRARLNEESLDKIRKQEAEKAAERRKNETPEQKEARRLANKLYQQKRRSMETPEQAESRKMQDLLYHKKKHQKRQAGKGEKNYEEVYVRVYSSGRKEIIGLVDPADSMFKSEES
jgi:hypothetical protein